MGSVPPGRYGPLKGTLSLEGCEGARGASSRPWGLETLLSDQEEHGVATVSWAACGTADSLSLDLSFKSGKKISGNLEIVACGRPFSYFIPEIFTKGL